MTGLDTTATRAGVQRVLWVTLGLNLGVSAAKIAVGLLSGSLAMVADGYHSLVDGSNNVIGLIVAAYAFAPPDRGHPYGHRKFETAAAAAIGVALLALAYHVLEGALARVAEPAVPAIGPLNWAVMGVTMAVNLFVSWYEDREGRRLGSAFLVADATHTRADLFVSLGVVATFAAAKVGLAWADPLAAAVIAAVIAVQAVKILISAFNVLTDRAAIDPEPIESLAASVAGVRRVRDVRTRGRGDAVYVDLVVHLDGEVTLREAHEVADRIEEALKAAHPEIVDVVVHPEPAG
ncbi:MAG: cation diffusion facilitator family transporter [Acidobacteria bacterium]|jgi:cation diffusion facilitator family transporter|nr:cation diffusion facilitator family transporter [Acidobacteriota bacterium]